jgi:radical SAM superfamily enzyme YgiQ (UPF0313 family)
MKVLLLNPPPMTDEQVTKAGWCGARSKAGTKYPPYDLLSIAAILEKGGFEIKLIDSQVDERQWSKIKEDIKNFSPDLTFMVTSTPSITYDLSAAKAIKELTRCKTVLCGPHISYFSKKIINEKYIDFLIRGEPEITALELVKTLDKKKNLRHVQGLTYKENKKIKENKERPLIENLNKIPFPSHNLVPLRNYYSPLVKKTPFILTMSSRGCPFNCIYCLSAYIYKRKFRPRSAKNVVDEMIYAKKLGVKSVIFFDDTFTIDKKRVLEICKEINRRRLDIEWICDSRVDTVDKEMLNTMKMAGCRLILYGVESGSQEILNNIKKGITIAKIRQTFALTKQVGIEALAFFILGLPGETKETIKQTVHFAKELDPDYVQFTIATPYPGTEFYDLVKRKKWLLSKKWSDYDMAGHSVVRTEKLKPKDIEKALQVAYREFYLRPSHVLKRIRKIRSFDEMKRTARAGFNVLQS